MSNNRKAGTLKGVLDAMVKVLCLTLLLMGCHQKPQPPKEDKPISNPPLVSGPTRSVRLARVWSGFTNEIIQARLDTAQSIFAARGLNFHVKEIVELNKPEWNEVTEADLNSMRAWDTTQTQTFFLVDKITYNGVRVGGLGYKNGIAIIAVGSCLTVFAHEWGHTCGLKHTAEGNVMSEKTCGITDNIFTPEQMVTLIACAKDRTVFLWSDEEPFICPATAN